MLRSRSAMRGRACSTLSDRLPRRGAEGGVLGPARGRLLPGRQRAAVAPDPAPHVSHALCEVRRLQRGRVVGLSRAANHARCRTWGSSDRTEIIVNAVATAETDAKAVARLLCEHLLSRSPGVRDASKPPEAARPFRPWKPDGGSPIVITVTLDHTGTAHETDALMRWFNETRTPAQKRRRKRPRYDSRRQSQAADACTAEDRDDDGDEEPEATVRSSGTGVVRPGAGLNVIMEAIARATDAAMGDMYAVPPRPPASGAAGFAVACWHAQLYIAGRYNKYRSARRPCEARVRGGV